MTEPFKYDPSMTASFKGLSEQPAVIPDNRTIRAVVLGGGTGTNISIRTLLNMGFETSAVVAMADDGGSTGIIREEAHVTPPGDVRKCIGAMAADQDDPFTHAFKYRFEFARNHTLGNLMLSALEDATGSFPEAIRICESMLHARGHVYPSTLTNVHLSALDRQGILLTGQAEASHSQTPLMKVWLTTIERVRPYEGALKAIDQADLILLGPGSLYTSIIPNLLVPGIIEAIAGSAGKTVFLCGVADNQGETSGLSARQHVEALYDHGMEGLLDFVVCHASHPLHDASAEREFQESLPQSTVHPVALCREDVAWMESKGSMVYVRNMVNPKRQEWHRPEALRGVLTEIVQRCHLLQM